VVEEELKQRLTKQEELLEKIYLSTEKTRRYFLWTLIASLVIFVLPFVGLLFIIPQFLDLYDSISSGF